MSHFCYEDISPLGGQTVEGEITSINRDDLTATVKDAGLSNLDNVPIHYHCDRLAVQDDGKCLKNYYPDAMDEQGAGAFAIGDKVLVLFQGMNRARPMIIGFTGDDKQCCNFIFSLQGSDGVELTENVIFSIYDENQNSLPVIDMEYDEDEEYWSFSLETDQEDAEGNKIECVGPFWAKYFKGGYKHTQYQGKNSDTGGFWLPADRVILGDGTLYSDVLEILVGEVGYWEDWEDNLLCGKHDWYYAPQHFNNELCPELPWHQQYDGAEGHTVDSMLDIAGETLSMSTTSVGWEQGASFTTIEDELIWQADGPDDYVPGAAGYFEIKATSFINYVGGEFINNSVGLYVYLVINENLFWYFETNGLWDPDDYDGVEVVELTGNNQRIEVPEEMLSEMAGGIYSVKLRTSCWGIKGTASISLDYIHFPRWEEWDNSDEPELCKNRDWRASWWLSEEEKATEDCPSLPFGKGTSMLSIVYSILIGTSANDGDVDLRHTLPEGNNSLINISTMIIKATAAASGSSYPDVQIRLTIEDVNYYFYLAGGGADYWCDYDPDHRFCIGDNDGEEQIIYFKDYGDLTDTVTISSIVIGCHTYDSDYASFALDYIDFA